MLVLMGLSVTSLKQEHGCFNNSCVQDEIVHMVDITDLSKCHTNNLKTSYDL